MVFGKRKTFSAASVVGGAIVVGMMLTAVGALQADELIAPQQVAARIDATPAEHPLVPALKLADAALQKVAAVGNYEAVFVKKEVVRGTFIEQKMQIRFRKDPMSVYLKFVEPHDGRQVIFVKGQHGGKMLVKETGLAALAGTISLDPNGSMALAESQYPITMIGMENMTRRLITQWLEATKRDDISIKFYPNAKIGAVECKVVESTITHQNPSGIHQARLYIDKSTGLPIRVQTFGFPGRRGEKSPVLSDYAYLNVRIDVGMTAMDFDTRNPRYGF